MKSAYDIIKRPIITEKSSGLVDKLQYTFEVAVDANKVEIKKAIEAAFGVKVEKVNTLNTKAKEVSYSVIVKHGNDVVLSKDYTTKINN